MSVTFSKFIMLDTLRWLHPRDKFRGHSNVTPYTYRSNEVVQVNRGIDRGAYRDCTWVFYSGIQRKHCSTFVDSLFACLISKLSR